MAKSQFVYVCVEYSRAGIWEYYTWDENATSATKLYVTVASCGHSGQTSEKKKRKKKEKLRWGDRRFRSRHMVIIITQRGKNLLTTYHTPPG